MRKEVYCTERMKKVMDNQMFCYQCQETAGGKGCTKFGVCGKDPEIANLQDILIYVTKGLSCVTTRLRQEDKVISREINHLITQNLFATVTNTNFDRETIADRIMETIDAKEALLPKVRNPEDLPEAVFWEVEDGLDVNTKGLGVLATQEEDVRSLRELITYGLKGLSAYMKHANALGQEDEKIDAFIQKALSMTLDDGISEGDLMKLVLETGRVGVLGMALLDTANNKRYGTPSITSVDLGVGKNPGILVSGHDLRDLEMLLEQTKGTGVDIYTHSEMLPAHYYPKFKKYPHLAGNYGNAWWEQRAEFEKFHGPILMTTNCVVPPGEKYKDRLWTTGTAGVAGCRHIFGEYGETKDFSGIIKQAKKCAPPEEIETGRIIGGFAHSQIMALSELIVNSIKNGDIRKFVVMAGCDGRMKSRKYYTEFAENLPDDVVILTAGCAKYRYIKQNLSDIGSIPRVLDAGQCNDSYSLAVIMLELKKIFDLKDINELPIVVKIAWYEQKAVIVLLALLSLGIKNIHLGPTLPAFLSPGVTRILAHTFGISGIGTVDSDLKLFFGDKDNGKS